MKEDYTFPRYVFRYNMKSFVKMHIIYFHECKSYTLHSVINQHEILILNDYLWIIKPNQIW